MEKPLPVAAAVAVLLALGPWSGLAGVPVAPAQALASPLRDPRWLRPMRRDFAYRDRELLLRGQQRGGRLVVPAQVQVRRGRFPLLVILHGLNSSGRLHPLLHPGDDDEYDLVTSLQPLWRQGRLPPFLVAAPTQSRAAGYGPDLWTRFQLDEFVAAAQKALPLGVEIDGSQIVVAGHSGAGCSPRGGLLGVVARRHPGLRLVAAVDTCQNRKLGRLWRERLGREQISGAVRFWSLWQTDWKRAFRAFERALGLPEEPETVGVPPGVRSVRRAGRMTSVELDLDQPGPHGPHLATLSRFLELVLPTVWAPVPPPARAPDRPPAGRSRGSAR